MIVGSFGAYAAIAPGRLGSRAAAREGRVACFGHARLNSHNSLVPRGLLHDHEDFYIEKRS
jgi:hypothetical protein